MVKEARFSGEQGYEFSADTITALHASADEARRFNHSFVGTEHILLGLARSEMVSKLLTRYGLEISKMRSAVEFIIGKGDRAVTDEISPTPRAKRVIELAARHATRDNRTEVQPKDLLVGLILEGEGIAAGVLESLGVNYGRISNDPELQNFRDKKTILLDTLEKGFSDPDVEQWKKDAVLSIVRSATEILTHQQTAPRN